jgi:hypothetical protein
VEDGRLGIGLLRGPLRRAVIGSGFPVSGFGPKSLVYPTICQIFVPGLDSWYIVSMSIHLLVNSTGYCVDHYLSISIP